MTGTEDIQIIGELSDLKSSNSCGTAEISNVIRVSHRPFTIMFSITKALEYALNKALVSFLMKHELMT